MEIEHRTQKRQSAQKNHSRKLTLLAAGLLAATAALNGHAEPTAPSAGMVFVNPAVQYIVYEHNRALDNYDLKDHTGWQFGVEYLLTDRFAIEALYSEQKPNIDDNTVNHNVDVKDRRWRLDGLYYFPNSSRWVPYVAGGAGEGRFEYDVDDAAAAGFGGRHDRETQLNLGGGVRYLLTEHVSLRGDLRAVHSLDENKTDAVASLGLSFNFGGQKPAPVVAPPPPPPEPVAPPPPPPEPQIEKVKLSSEALFDFDKATLRPGARQSLDELSARLSDKSKRIESIKIYGHTDRIGAPAYNQKLSAERAASVKEYLVSHGVPAGKVYAEGKGSSDPVTTDCAGTKRSKALIECLQPDRRVEVHITAEREVRK